MAKITLHKTTLAKTLVFIALVGLWYLLAQSGLIGATLIASPSEVFLAFVQGFSGDARPSQQIHLHAIATILRALEGWSYALLIGVSLGLLLGSRVQVYRVFEPLIEFARSIPPILIFPLLLVAHNYGPASYTWTIAFGCIPVMTLSVARGFSSLEAVRIDILKIYGVSRIRKIALTSMELLPSIFLGARLCFSLAIIIATVTEMVFTPRSGFALGALARDSEIEFNTPVFYSSLLVIGAFGYAANLLFHMLEDRFRGADG